MNVTALPKLAKPITTTTAPLHANGFDFKFDELSVELESGFGAGSFEGTAEINYYTEDGQTEIFVGDITLRCSKWNALTNQYDVLHVPLRFSQLGGFQSALYLAIYSELIEGSFRDLVEAAMEEYRS